MFWFKAQDRRQHLISELKHTKAELNKRQCRSLCRMEPVELGQLVLEVWSHLGTVARKQLSELFAEEGFIDAWLHLLEKGKTGEKILAANILGGLKIDRAVAPLLNAIGDRDDGVQLAAAAALGNIRDPRCLKPLLTALRDPLKFPPSRIAEVFIAIGSPSIPLLIELIDEGPEELTKTAIAILANFKDEHVAAKLENCLKAGTASVRAAAADALGVIGLSLSESFLMEALLDPSAKVRAAAARALGRLKCKEAAELLKDRLNDGSWEVRTSSAAALKEIAATKD